MNFLSRLLKGRQVSPREVLSSTYFHFFFFIIIWVLCFREFIFGQLPFEADAGAYFQHIKFYIQSLMKGIYPLWNSLSDNQAPTEFFLRRFDSFNPVFFLLILFKILGVSFESGYRLFLAIYYLFAMTGFYLLAKRILGNNLAAFVAFLLLTFSSLGTRIIDSYVIFMFTGIVWFFYFLVAFTQDLQKKYLLGAIFCLMVLVTTYVPFYFLVIFVLFVITFFIVYFSEIKTILKRYGEFIQHNKLFTAFCIVVLALTLLVPILFYLESGTGEFELPMRAGLDGQIDAPHVLTVSLKTITGWGIVEDLMFSSFYLFSQLSHFQKAIFYIPLFAYILLLCGLITKMNRKLLFLAVWGLSLLVINLPYATPVYAFLYDHIFIFKYFRNLHFFLWVILLPIFILFAVEQFRLFWAFTPKTKKEKIGLAVFLVVVHIGAAVFLYLNGSRNWSSYAVSVLSFMLFCFHFIGRKSVGILPILLGLVIILEPLEVYHYFIKNSQLPPIVASVAVDSSGKNQGAVVPKREIPWVYYGVKWRYLLMQSISPEILSKYSGDFLAYDRVEVIGNRVIDFEKIGRIFSEGKNLAFVAIDGKKFQIPAGLINDYPPSVEILTESENFKVLESNANSIKFKINFPRTRFFVYNNSYHSGWQAFINGKKVDLWRTNVAFRGVWVPAGESIVQFKFGTPAKYWFNIFILILFYSVFAGVIWLNLRKDHNE